MLKRKPKIGEKLIYRTFDIDKNAPGEVLTVISYNEKQKSIVNVRGESGRESSFIWRGTRFYSIKEDVNSKISGHKSNEDNINIERSEPKGGVLEMTQRKISASELIADIRNSMNDADLMTKYQIPLESLQLLFNKLIKAGHLKQSEIDFRNQATSKYSCPACGATQDNSFEECPKCGIFVAKFKARPQLNIPLPSIQNETFPQNPSISISIPKPQINEKTNRGKGIQGKKTIAIVAIVFASSIIGYIGIKGYNQRSPGDLEVSNKPSIKEADRVVHSTSISKILNPLIGSLSPHVKNASLHLQNSIRYEIEAGSNISYKELFDKYENSISEIDKKIIEVQTIAGTNNQDITNPVLEYLKDSQALLRALLFKYRKQLNVQNAYNLVDKTKEGLNTSNSYHHEYAEKLYETAQKDLKKITEEFTPSVKDILIAAKNLRNVYAKVSIVMPIETLIDPIGIDAIIKKNENLKLKSP
ncbi:MAG: hypothetical protein NTU74_01795 [Deltaproteobacteria bacterium]|nr:hypothetical protein [Deltaproteobacteria bacterium]